MIPCKNCHQNHTVKNGYVRHKQRYKCHSCGYNFVEGDARHKRETELKKALSIILYSLGKSSFGFLGKLFGVSRTTTYYWVRQVAATIDEPTIAHDVQAIDFDEMWHFLQSKKENSGLSKPWIIAQGTPLPGYSVVVMLQPSNACMRKSSI
jgi:transposase